MIESQGQTSRSKVKFRFIYVLISKANIFVTNKYLNTNKKLKLNFWAHFGSSSIGGPTLWRYFFKNFSNPHSQINFDRFLAFLHENLW